MVLMVNMPYAVMNLLLQNSDSPSEIEIKAQEEKLKAMLMIMCIQSGRYSINSQIH